MKKTISILRWCGVMILNLLGFLTAPIIFPILYPFRKGISKVKPFWHYFDDEDGVYGTEWFRESLSYGNKEDWWSKFRIAYKWLALRNPAWNLQASLTPKEGDIIIKNVVVSDLYKDGAKVNDPLVTAQFKYVDANGEYKDNKGDYLSFKYSRLGKNYVWYNIDDKLYFRYSFANEVKWLGGLWLEFHIGTTYRYTFRLKIKNPKVYELDI